MKVLGDGWTAVTKDGSLSAHFEHTVVVVNDGARILTLSAAGTRHERRTKNEDEQDDNGGATRRSASLGHELDSWGLACRSELLVLSSARSAWTNDGAKATVVTELLPSQLAKVSLDGRHQVIAHLGDPVHRNYIRVLVGDRVKVALMPADRTRGRIVEKV